MFFGMPAFVMNTKVEALHAIRDAWRKDNETPDAFCQWMFGNVYDTSDRGDLSHMDEAAAKPEWARSSAALGDISLPLRRLDRPAHARRAAGRGPAVATRGASLETPRASSDVGQRETLAVRLRRVQGGSPC